MKTTELPALAELRESLREAAERDVAARAPARRRRRRRRTTGLIVALLLGGAAVAGAADLISSGDPVRDELEAAGAGLRPAAGVTLSVKAADEPLPWGVGIFTSKDGEECVLFGRQRGTQIGVLERGVFRPYKSDRGGACGRTDSKLGIFSDLTEREGRTLIAGRAKPGARTVVAVVDGERYTARTGVGGAFIFVFKGSVSPSSVLPG